MPSVSRDKQVSDAIKRVGTLPRGFGLWPVFLQHRWLREQGKPGGTMNNDRWKKAVEKAVPRTAKCLRGDPSITQAEAVTLLRRQHAAFVRLVKKRIDNSVQLQRLYSREGLQGSANYHKACKEAYADLLAALAKMKD